MRSGGGGVADLTAPPPHADRALSVWPCQTGPVAPPGPSDAPLEVIGAGVLATWEPPVGWSRHEGFDLSTKPWDLDADRQICVGLVDESTRASAVVAFSRGAGLAVAIDLQADQRHRFLEDLHKLSVGGEAGVATLAPVASVPDLHGSLLDELAAGATITDAADAIGVSRRTATRMVSEACKMLGVDSTVAAISAWSQGQALG